MQELYINIFTFEYEYYDTLYVNIITKYEYTPNP